MAVRRWFREKAILRPYEAPGLAFRTRRGHSLLNLGRFRALSGTDHPDEPAHPSHIELMRFGNGVDGHEAVPTVAGSGDQHGFIRR
jgi:hypothetical protein